jgi:hypothetical protein
LQAVVSPTFGDEEDFNGASVTAIDATGAAITGATATTDVNGAFGLCLPNGGPFSVELTADGGQTTYSPELEDPDAGPWAFQVGVVAPTSLQDLAAVAPGGFAASQGIVAVAVLALEAGNPACQLTGWTFGLALPDGGPVAAGGYQVLYTGPESNTKVVPGATATGLTGNAYLYNIDTTVSDFFVVTASSPAMPACQPVGASIGLTGRVYVAAGATTVYPLVLP